MSDINFSKLTWENLPARTTALSATNLNRIEKGIDDSVNGVNANSHSIAELQTRISQIANGSPTPVATVAEMTDESAVYLYTGSETGYTAGNWYYYDGSAWTSGGVYGGAVTDTTLSISGAPADAKAVGDALAERAYSDDLTAVDERVSDLKSAINISSPALTLNANKYVYITGDIFNGNGFSYTDPVEVKKGDHITLTAAGYLTNVAMISECESDGTITSVVTKSSDDSVQKYEHMMLHDGYVCFSFMHTKSYKVEIIGGQVVESTIAFKLTADAYRFIPFEKGNINISNSGWTYVTSDTRIRTPEGYTVHCHAGDTFGLSSYSNARFYVGWKRLDGTYGNLGWLQRDFTVTEDGDYIFTITAVPETTVSNVEDLSSLCKYSITKPVDDVYEYVNSLAALVPQNNNIRSINHRGWHEAPENTLTAFKQSRVRGFEYVETDVRFTSDGVAVLLHDVSINRVARNADGTAISSTVNIADITYAEALTYDFGIYKGSQYAGTKIARFDDFIYLCKKIGLKPYIEFKTGPYNGLLGMFWRIDRAGMHDKVTWLSFDKDLLGTVKTNVSDARLGLLTDTISQTVIDAAENLKSSDNDVFISASYANLTDELVNLCLNANLPLEVWTVDDKSILINIDRYVTGVTSNLFIAGNELFKANI